MEIGEELASRRIGGGPEVVEIVFFVSVMVDGCGRQEESGTEAADVSVDAPRCGGRTKKVWGAVPVCGRHDGRWLDHSEGHHGRWSHRALFCGACEVAWARDH